ncbi:hypothetical protein BU15DRAFT_77306 [Melanogaster broomeanus]|nr:hypothetical protein BU15DRAFT_77306 [Melanogaster broomeanus]
MSSTLMLRPPQIFAFELGPSPDLEHGWWYQMLSHTCHDQRYPHVNPADSDVRQITRPLVVQERSLRVEGRVVEVLERLRLKTSRSASINTPLTSCQPVSSAYGVDNGTSVPLPDIVTTLPMDTSEPQAKPTDSSLIVALLCVPSSSTAALTSTPFFPSRNVLPTSLQISEQDIELPLLSVLSPEEIATLQECRWRPGKIKKSTWDETSVSSRTVHIHVIAAIMLGEYGGELDCWEYIDWDGEASDPEG